MADAPTGNDPRAALGAPTTGAARWLGHVVLTLVWVLALAPVALWAVHRQDPELAVRIAQVASFWVGRGLLAGALVLLLLTLLWPPFLAGIRLSLSRFHTAVTTNQATLRRAYGELQHFESGARHLEVGRLLRQAGDLRKAGPHLARAVELDPQLPGAHFQLGMWLFQNGQYGPAASAFLAAERGDPGHAFGDALLHAGRCAFLLGQNDAAVQLLRQHAAAHGGNRKSHLWLGDALAVSGDLAAARAAWQVAAAPVTQRLTAEENWHRALARVRLWRRGGKA